MKKIKDFFKRIARWINRGWFPDHELSVLEEEQLESPGRVVFNNFRSKKLAMAGVIIFFVIFLFVMIGPVFLPIDLSYQDSSQANLPPGYSYMAYPSELKGNVADIAPGYTYGFSLDTKGDVSVWGVTRITEKVDIGDVPEEVLDADIVSIAAGTDHVVALDSDNVLHIWGNNRLGQDRVDGKLTRALKAGGEVVQLSASNQFSAVVMSDGNLYLWGNANMADIKCKDEFQGQIAKVALTDYEYISLLNDGTVAYTGFNRETALARIPAELEGKRVVDIAATSGCVAAVTEDGEVFVWGNATKGEKDVPAFEAKPVEIYGGRYHYTVLLENGDVVSWGDNTFGQCDVPEAVHNADISTVFAGGLQNYAVTESGDIITWGLKGYVLGTDALGRDILARIVNGGRVTMMVGAIAVIIATILGVLLGGIAGYFGGWVDVLVMRIAEIVGGLPFIPFAMILSSILGNTISETNRMYLIMVILGVLSWPPTCRLVRAQMFAEREKEFVKAAKAMGIHEVSIVFKQILPNIFSILMVSMTLDFATCMLTESTLSYLGFGIALPTPTWGNMLTGANNSIVIQQYWWQWVFPAAIFGLCTICINLIGDGLRDAVDPKSNER